MNIKCKVSNVHNWTVDEKHVAVSAVEEGISFHQSFSVKKTGNKALFDGLVPDAAVTVAITLG